MRAAPAFAANLGDGSRVLQMLGQGRTLGRGL